MTKARDDASMLGCDRLLRFEPPIQRRYEAEHGDERLDSLRRNIIVGLTFYNMYNLTAIALMPDILWLSVFLRVGVVTTGSILIAWSLGVLSPRQRENLVLIGVINAFVVPVFLFWYTRAPLGNYSFGELPLHLVFGDMMLALRFRHALIFTIFCFLATVIATVVKPGIPHGLVLPFVLQSLTAASFAIYANYQIERRRCRDYLDSLQARLRSEEAELSEQRYRDLSLTDPLTGLPNRRALDQRLEQMFESMATKSALMIDVDYFKAFNDNEGHTQGDLVLKKLADCLTSVLARFSAKGVINVWCARFGGEEFIIVGEIESTIANELARAVMDAVRRADIPHPSRPDELDRLTVSVGVALAATPRKLSPIDLLVSADTALYEAKRLGRNQIVSSTFGPRAGSLQRIRPENGISAGPS